MGIDPSGYGVIDDYNYQTKQKSNVMQSFREEERKSLRPSNFYMDYYTSDNRGATPFPKDITKPKDTVKTPAESLEEQIMNCTFDQVNAMISDDMDFSKFTISELKALYDKIDGLGVGKKAFDNVKNKNSFLRNLKKYIKNNQEKPKEEEDKKWWQTEAFSIAATALVAVAGIALIACTAGIAAPLIGAAIGGVVGLGVTAYGYYKDDGELNAGAGTYIKSFVGGAIAGALIGGSAGIAGAAVTGGAITLGTGMLGVGLAGSAGSIARQQITTGKVNYGQVAYEGVATALTFGTFTMISQYMSGAYSSSLQPSGNNYKTLSKEDYDYIYGNKTSGQNIVGTKHADVKPTQEYVNQEKVGEYVNKLTSGENVEPIEIVRIPNKGDYIIEGHHRYVASQETGIPVDTVVTEGGGPVGFADWSYVSWKEYITEEQFWGG